MKHQLLLLLALLAIAPLLALPLPSVARQAAPMMEMTGITGVANFKEPLKAGDMAPDFTLTSHDGRNITLSASRGKRPVVLVFYRGYW
jgi:cytochrome oxidase Cu insertion factor (SCO1/SenC/PrrC family)